MMMGKKDISMIGRGRKGSTLILVVALLSVLILIALTLSYTAKLELISADNFAKHIQVRMAAATGLPIAAWLFSADPLVTSFTQQWANATIPSISESALSGYSDAEFSNPVVSQFSSIATLHIFDESGRVNINAAGNLAGMSGAGYSTFEIDLEKVIAAALANAQLDQSLAPTISKAIIAYRYGPDGKPGVAGVDDDGDNSSSDLSSDGIDNDKDGVVDNSEEKFIGVEFDRIDNNQDVYIDDGNDGIDNDALDNDGDGEIDEVDEGIDEPDEFVSDIRLAPNGDDVPFYTLTQLFDLPEITLEIFDAIAPYLTVFSSTTDLVPYSYDEGSQLELSSVESESAEATGEIFLKPLDINTASLDEIIHYFEIFIPDKNPYLIRQFAANILDARDSDNVPTVVDEFSTEPIIGIELVPFINEVHPDSETDDDDGDDGQYIELYNPFSESIDLTGWSITAGGTIYLNTTMPPGGYLVITDDLDESNDPDPEDDIDGYGCFYDIFGVVPGGDEAQIIEDANLDLPNDSGTVYLKDPAGNLVDFFEYEGGTFDGLRQSFQRNDPRIRYAEKLDCTPLSQNVNYLPPESTGDGFAAPPQNRLFTGPIEIMYVYSGFFDGANDVLVNWKYPDIVSDDPDVIDSRVIDLFIHPIENLSVVHGGKTGEDDEGGSSASAIEIEATVIGKININTASTEVLISLPGMTESLAKAIIRYRLSMENRYFDGELESSAPFSSRSELFQADSIWEGYTVDKRIEVFSRFENLITVRSRAFSLIARNFRGTGAYEEQNPSSNTVLTIVAVDEKMGHNIIYWGYWR